MEVVDSIPAAAVDRAVAAAVHTRTVAAAGMLPAVSRQVFELAGQLPSSDSMQVRLDPYPAMQKTNYKKKNDSQHIYNKNKSFNTFYFLSNLYRRSFTMKSLSL